MRKLGGIGLVTLGLMAGAGAISVWNSATVQAQENHQINRALNARFLVGNAEVGAQLDSPYQYLAFRFLKDKRAGDCYLASFKDDYAWTMIQMIKTDDEACAGLN